MDRQKFEELWITLNELYSANRYLEYTKLSSVAIESANTLGLYDKVMHLLRNSCMSYFQIGDLQISINLLEKYRELTFLHGNDIDLMQYYALVSIYWGAFGHLKKSEELLMKGFDIAKRMQHIESMGKIYNDLSNLEIEFGQYEKAKRLALKSLFYANEFETKHDRPYTGVVHAKTNLATAHIWLNEFDEAIVLIQELLITIKDPPYTKVQLEVFNTQALLYEKQGYISEAIDMYQKSKYYALQNNDLSLLQIIYNALVQLIEKQGNKMILCAVQKEYIHILLEMQKGNYTQVLFEMEYNDQKKHFEKTSYIDPLTNIYNRRYFDEHAKEMMKSAANDQKLALLMIDLDHFKSINDSNGHLFGDDALAITAATLQQFFQPYESIVARFGGDEFIVLIHLREDESISIIAQHLYNTLTSLVLTVHYDVVQLEFSIGVSTNESGHITSVAQLIREADSALYTSKRNGRNQITRYNQYSNAGNVK